MLCCSFPHAHTCTHTHAHIQTTPHYIGMLAKLIPRICAGCKYYILAALSTLIKFTLSICASVDVEDLRKMSNQLSILATEKQKAKVRASDIAGSLSGLV